MKKIFFCAIASLCMIVVACFAFSASAAEVVDSGSCGKNGSNLTWALDDAGVLTISGSGDMKNFTSSSHAPWYSYRGSITDVVIGDSVTTIGNYAFAYCDSLTSVTIPDSVTTIGDYAFDYCDSLTSVTIPDSVTTISDYAFRNCTSLTSVTIPDSVTTIGDLAFAYCDSLTSVTIPDSVTTIGDLAFYNCNSIEKVYITSLESWMNISFLNAGSSPLCYGADLYLNGELLTELIIPDSITTINSYWFRGCTSITSVTIPDSVTTIGEYAFDYCDSLTSVTIPDSVTTIGVYAFRNCYSIEKVYITSLESWTNISFYDSYSSPLYYGADLYLNGKLLTELIIPDSITTINSYSFRQCTSLTNVTIGTGITSIENQFSGCTNLENIIIPTSVTSISTSAFDSLKLIIHGFTGSTADTFSATKGIAFVSLDGFMANYIDGGKCGDNATWELYRNGKLIINGTGKMYDGNITTSSYVRSVEIADGITTIGNSAFYGRDSLTSVTIPDSVTTIGEEAFYSCDSLASVTIGDSVTTIGNCAFEYCYSLASVTIPDSVTTIGNSAFYGCDSLTSVTIPDSVTTIGNSAFYYCKSLASVTIPDSVTTIGDYAFRNCDGLTSFTIPDSVTTIGRCAFYECNSLASVTIGDSVTTIGNYAFENCNNIEKVNITSLDSWMNISFSNAGSTPLYYGADLYLNGTKLINLTIPATQESIKNYAFYGCESLKTITIPNTTTSIPDSAFKGCNNATIYGYAGSTAETTARSLVLPFVALDEGWQAKLMYNGKCGNNLMWQLYQNGDLVLSFMNSATSDVIYDYTSSSLPTWNTYSTLVRNVVFPKGITRVGDYAFDQLTGIVTVSYSGDEDSWKETELGTGNLPLEKAYIIYGEAMNVNINYKDVVKTTATVNGKVIPVIINLEAGTIWQELKDNLIYSDYTDVIVYDHDGNLIDTEDLLCTGFILHHINKDGAVIEEILISVSGDVTGDSAVNVDDIQNVVAHLAGEDNELNKIAIDKDLNDVLTMEELNTFIATFR